MWFTIIFGALCLIGGVLLYKLMVFVAEEQDRQYEERKRRGDRE